MVVRVVHHDRGAFGRGAEAPLAEDVALVGGLARELDGPVEEVVVLLPEREVVRAAVDVPVRAERPNVVVHVVPYPFEPRPDLVGRGRLVRREKPDVESVPAEGMEERRVVGLVEIPLLLAGKPAPALARHQFVRQAVVADLAAGTDVDEVGEVLRDLLGIRLRIQRVGQDRHRTRHGVERCLRATEREVVVVRKRIKLLFRRIRETRVDAGEARRKLAERLQDALVAEVLRHDAEEVRLRVLEAKPVEEPAEVGLRDRDVRRRGGHGRHGADARKEEKPFHRLSVSPERWHGADCSKPFHATARNEVIFPA